jgi:hypothetical protein
MLRHVDKKVFPSVYKPFRARLPSNLQKSANMKQKLFWAKLRMRSNPLKSCKKVHAKEVINEKVIAKLSLLCAEVFVL